MSNSTSLKAILSRVPTRDAQSPLTRRGVRIEDQYRRPNMQRTGLVNYASAIAQAWHADGYCGSK